MNITSLFMKPKIIGFIGDTHTGKSNTLYCFINELLTKHDCSIYAYGLRIARPEILAIHSIEELEAIRDGVVFIDELFSLFDLDNRKIKAQIENTLRLAFHHNNVLVLCGLGENFKKFISAKLHAVIFKKTTIADLINGSSAKRILLSYKGIERGTTILALAVNEALVFDGSRYTKINIPYLKEYDSKLNNLPILRKKEVKNVPENVQKKDVQKNVQKKGVVHHNATAHNTKLKRGVRT